MFWFSRYPAPHRFALTHNKNIRLRVVVFVSEILRLPNSKYIMQTRERNEEGMGIDRMFQFFLARQEKNSVISSGLGK